MLTRGYSEVVTQCSVGCFMSEQNVLVKSSNITELSFISLILPCNYKKVNAISLQSGI